MKYEKLLAVSIAVLLVLSNMALVTGIQMEHGVPSDNTLFGDGTPGDPYMIYDVHDLQNMSDNLSAHYALGDHIDASETYNWNSEAGFEPIGDNSNTFTGSLDGRGYKIYDLFINRSATDYVGLFGFADSGAKISNISFVGANITGNNRVGTVVGYLNSLGTLENCSVSNRAEPKYHLELDGTDEDYIDFGEMTGFMAGTSWSIIERVKIPAGADDTGGWHMFRGKAWEDRYGDITMKIQNDTSTDNVLVWLRTNTWKTLSMDNGQEGIFINEGEWYDIGVTYNSSVGEYKLYVNGIEVYNSTSIPPLDDSSNKNNLYFGGQDVSYGKGQGDLYSETDITIKHQAWIQSCLTPAEVTGYDGWIDPNTPGLFFSTYIRSNRVLDISGNGHNGTNGNSPIYHNESKTVGGIVTGTDNIGGLVGENAGTILSSYSSGNVTGRWYIGGLVGRNNGFVNVSHTSGNIYAASTSGGLIGVNAGTVNSSYSLSKVNGDEGNAGGLVGYNTGKVILSYATGDVNSTGATAHSTGGLVGWNNGGFVNNSYSRGDADGYQEVGGFVGQNGGDVNNSYSTGYAGGHSNLGGFCGADSGSISNSFYDNETSGWTTSSGGEGRNTSDMKNESTFTDVGWDFNGTWYIIEDGPTYPLLKWQPLPTGSGTQEDPYWIFDVWDLQNMRSDLSANYVLMNDIDASETAGWNGGNGFEPIGNNHDPFEGSLEGQGYAISGLYINRTSTSYVGLIGYLASGTMSNISILDNDITGSSRVGGLVGYNDLGTISNSSVTGTVGGELSVGGLVGLNDNQVSNCYANVKLTSYRADGNADNAGGLVGKNNGIVSRSYATGNLSGDRYVGGLVGYLYSGTIHNTYSSMYVTGTTNVGGLIGTNNSGTVENSFWDNETSGWQTSAGGTGKNTTEMKTQNTFTDVGWDFIDTWWMIENVTYPLFIWQGVAVGITSPYPEKIFSTSNVTVDWEGSTVGPGDITYRIRINEGLWIDKNTTTTHVFTNLSDGNHIVDVEVKDKYGHSAMDSIEFMVDVLEDPVINITSPYEGEMFSSTNVTVYWNGSDDLSGIDHYQIRINGDSWINKSAVETSHQFTGILEGNNTVYLRAYDNAGNSAEDNVTFLIDLTAPEVNITSPVEGDIFNTSDITVNWTSSDSGSGISHYEIRVDQGGWIHKGVELSHEFTGLGEGNHTVDVRAYDNAENNAIDNVTFTLDLTSPTIEILSPNEGEIFSANTVTVEWNSSDDISGIDYYQIRIDGDSWINESAINTSHEFTGIPEGDHIVTIRAYDNVGNVGTDIVNFTVDLTSPTANITSPEEGDMFSIAEVIVYWTGSDDLSGMDHYQIRINGDSWINKTAVETSHQFTGIPEGNNTVYLRAYDNAGNSAYDNVTFLIDLTAPEVNITSPVEGDIFNTSDITVNWTCSDSGSGISHYEIRIDQEGWINKGVELSHEFTGLGEGNHTVDVRAYDNTGNYAIDNVNFTLEFEINYIIITPGSQDINAGESQAYTAMAYDEYGGEKGNVTSETNWLIEGGSGGSWVDNVYHSEFTGDWNITGDYSGLTDTATLRVLAGDADSIVISPQNETIKAGDDISYFAKAYDEFGNEIGEVIPSYSIENEAGGHWSSYVYYSQYAGTWTVKGNYEGIETTATLIVEPGDVSTLDISPDSTIITTGETQGFTAVAYDAYANEIGNVTGDVDWAIQSGAGGSWVDNVYHSENIGTWGVTSTYMNGSDTVYLTVESKPVDYIVIEPQNATIDIWDYQSYTATAYDEDDNEIGDVTYETSWSIDPGAGGSWSGNSYTSENAGTWTVTGTYQSIDDYASLTVLDVVEYSLTLNAGDGGTTIPSPGMYTYEEGRTVNVQATPYDGWIFSHWTGDYPRGEAQQSTISIVMNNDKMLTANFVEEDAVRYELTINTDGTGTVEFNPDMADYAEGTAVTLTAIPSAGWEFVEWTGDLSEQNSEIIVYMYENITITVVFQRTAANFEVTDFTVDPTEGDVPLMVRITARIENVGTGHGSIKIIMGSESLNEWDLGPGESVSVDETYTFESTGLYYFHLGDQSISVRVGDIVVYSLNVIIDGEGTVSHQELYEEGDEVTLTAVPASGWEFVEWRGDFVGQEDTIIVYMHEDKTITAIFQEIEDVDDPVDPDDTTPISSEFIQDYWLILLIVIIAIVLAIVLMKKKGGAKPTESIQEPPAQDYTPDGEIHGADTYEQFVDETPSPPPGDEGGV